MSSPKLLMARERRLSSWSITCQEGRSRGIEDKRLHLASAGLFRTIVMEAFTRQTTLVSSQMKGTSTRRCLVGLVVLSDLASASCRKACLATTITLTGRSLARNQECSWATFNHRRKEAALESQSRCECLKIDCLAQLILYHLWLKDLPIEPRARSAPKEKSCLCMRWKWTLRKSLELLRKTRS